MLQLFRRPLLDWTACVERLGQAKRPLPSLAAAFLAAALFMFLYVPIHELLHVLGCIATGGEVSELGLADHIPLAASLTALSLLLSILFAFLTYAIGGLVADRVVGPNLPAGDVSRQHDAKGGD
jgi:hypothetical protein